MRIQIGASEHKVLETVVTLPSSESSSSSHIILTDTLENVVLAQAESVAAMSVAQSLLDGEPWAPICCNASNDTSKNKNNNTITTQER